MTQSGTKPPGNIFHPYCNSMIESFSLLKFGIGVSIHKYEIKIPENLSLISR